MNNRVIKIKGFRDIEFLKMFILQELKLVDYKTNYVAEFENRLRSYIERNHNLTIVFQYNSSNLEKDIRFNLPLTSQNAQPYPENFEMGNPLNRWLPNDFPKSADDIEKEETELQKRFQDKLAEFKDFLGKLEQFGNGRICIKES